MSAKPESLEGTRYRLSQRLLDVMAALWPDEFYPDNIYTVDSIDENGVATIVWENDNGNHDVTYTEQEIIRNIKEGKWVIV